MSELGLCCNLNGLLPEPAELDALGLTRGGWLRSPVQGSIELLDAAAALPPAVKLSVMLDNQCDEVNVAETPEEAGRRWPGWEQTLRRVARSSRVGAVECGNELDTFADTPPEFAAELIRRAVPVLRPAGIKVIATSVTSAHWQEYLGELVLACRSSLPDYVCGHFYGQGFEDVPQDPRFGLLANAIQRAHQLSGLPVALTEGGVKIGDVFGEAGQAAYISRWAALLQQFPTGIVPFGCYFAWLDQVGAPSERGDQAFGLRREDGVRRQAWYAFADAMQRAPVSPPAEPPPAPPAPVEVPTVPSKFNVGPGVLELMQQHQDEPATDELYHPIGAPKSQYSETFARSGARYVYVFDVNQTFRFLPDRQ